MGMGAIIAGGAGVLYFGCKSVDDNNDNDDDTR